MCGWGDERGQSIQVGAILLFATVIVAFSIYQAFVIPDQNRAVEFNHNLEVGQQVEQLRSAIVASPGRTGREPVVIKLGVRYPERAIALNPPPVSGSLRTEGTTDPDVNVSIQNADVSGETGDFWDGTSRNYSSGFVVYSPQYNEYAQSPETVYDSTVLYDRFPTRNLTRTEQTIVDGKHISVVALNGSYARSEQGAVTVQVERSSSSGTTVPVTNVSAGQNVTLLVPTTLSASQWEDLLDGQFVDQGGHVRRASLQTIPLPDTVGHYLRIELQPNVTYQLQMAKVGLGTGVQSESATYLTDTSGNRTSVPEGGTQQVVVSVRDRYNNHVSDVQVRANTSGSGSLTFAGENESDADGDVTITYHAPQDIDGSGNTVFVNVSLQGPREDVLGSFDPTTPENVTLQLTVENTDGSGLGGGGGGGGGAYALTWQDPSGQTGVECPGGANDVCTLYSNETADASLTAETDPVVPGATVTYLVNNSTVGTVSPSSGVTDSTGTDATTLEPEGTGR
ncbi:hypothetical protein VB773_07340 [Haloarculaceae archaeon H-GB2-1]|nr:hypothetical protein [Haloarculaceae archaeon H-GB2-1]